MSDHAYKILRKDLNLCLPSLNDLIKYRHLINKEISIFRNDLGVYVSSREKLHYILKKIVIRLNLNNDVPIKLKLDLFK
jgi:hypothetical protein